MVADGNGDEQREGHVLYDVGPSKGRIHRIFQHKNRVLEKALDINADIYHFHDPELIPVGLRLVKKGKKAIYDIHEDVPRDIKSKDWIPGIFRNLIAWWFEIYENRSARRLTALVTATPFINDRFQKLNSNSYNINNYPIINELDKEASWTTKEKAVCYIGEITTIRGAVEMVEAMINVDGKLYLAGSYEFNTLKDKLSGMDSYSKVEDLGFIDRKTYASILAKSMAGLVIFHPESNHINSQPNKIFEYMSAGVPVIGSNFPLWRQILEKDECGICIDPMDTEAIGNAISRLLHDPVLAEKLGNKGRELVRQKYNWEMEKQKLLELYRSLEE